MGEEEVAVMVAEGGEAATEAEEVVTKEAMLPVVITAAVAKAALTADLTAAVAKVPPTAVGRPTGAVKVPLTAAVHPTGAARAPLTAAEAHLTEAARAHLTAAEAHPTGAAKAHLTAAEAPIIVVVAKAALTEVAAVLMEVVMVGEVLMEAALTEGEVKAVAHTAEDHQVITPVPDIIPVAVEAATEEEAEEAVSTKEAACTINLIRILFFVLHRCQ